MKTPTEAGDSPPKNSDHRIEVFERRFRLLDEQIRVLERERQKLSAVVHHTDAGFLVLDSSLRVTWANSVFSREYCRKTHPGALLGEPCNRVLCGEATRCEHCPAALPFITGTVAHHEMQRDSGGQTRYLYVTAMPIRSLTGETDQCIVMVQDVSDLEVLRRSEEALRQSEARKGAILDTALDAIVTIDHEGNITEFNPSAERMFGYSREEVLGRSMAEVIVPPHLREAHRRGMARYLATGKAQVLGRLIEITAMRRDGTEFPVELAITRIPLGGAPVFTGFIRDITQRVQAEEALRQREEQLRHSQKMEAIGTLAGGVAHDFNNLLTGILGYAELLKLRSSPDDKVHQAADVIEKAATRAASLTQQLLGFARRGKHQNVTVDIHAAVQEVTRLLGRTLDKSINLRQDFGPQPIGIQGDPGQINQIVLNLTVNAADAMTQGGDIVFRTALVNLTEGQRRKHEECATGPHALLSVSDSGSGISKEVLPRIFEPFFTTKEQGKGTGMGLAMVYGIVQNHGGFVEVESEVGRGTTFSLYFPLARPRENPEGPGVQSIQNSIR